MTAHESKVTVKLSISIDVFTESNPNDIDDATLRDIVLNHLYEQMQANMSRDAVDIWLDDFKLDETKMEDGNDSEE